MRGEVRVGSRRRRPRAGRAQGRALADELGFSRTDATLIATAISEIARNIVVHVGGGEMLVRPSWKAPSGLTVVAARRGAAASATSTRRCATASRRTVASGSGSRARAA